MNRRNFTKSHQTKVYESRRFENPFFQDKKRFKFPWKKIFASILVLITLSGFVYFIFYSPLFRINSIAITGLTTISTESVEDVIENTFLEKRLLVLPKDNRFIFQSDDLHSALQDAFDFAELDITQHGNAIEISLEERITSILWVSGDRYVIADLDGNVIEDLVANEEGVIDLPSAIPKVFDASFSEIALGDYVLAEYIIQNIITFDSGVRKLNFEPEGYEIESPEFTWFTVKTTSGLDLMFDAGKGTEVQLLALEVTLREHKDDLAELEYIDLRFGDHVYVK
ncbi:MAG: hypothetical protein Q8P30_00900 [Candidatus Uhrbacteria bacterium]|nr:hypothetical protein [Candidatus Uhrbacteria bacterium]